MPNSNIGLFAPVTASDGIHDNDVTDDSIRMGDLLGALTCDPRDGSTRSGARVLAAARSGWGHSPARAGGPRRSRSAPMREVVPPLLRRRSSDEYVPLPPRGADRRAAAIAAASIAHAAHALRM